MEIYLSNSLVYRKSTWSVWSIGSFSTICNWTILAQKVILAHKIDFCDFARNWLQWAFVFPLFGENAKLIIFIMKLTKCIFSCRNQFSVFTFTSFWMLHEFHHFRHVVFLNGGRKRDVDTLRPFRQKAFWSPKLVLGLKNPILLHQTSTLVPPGLDFWTFWGYSFVTLLHCYTVTLLHCYFVILLLCYFAAGAVAGSQLCCAVG